MPDEVPYNPLDIPSVALALALEILEQPLTPLPPEHRFPGTGVYLLYYTGDLELYSSLWTSTDAGRVPRVPVYVGKGERTGKRKGYRFTPTAEAAIFQRLRNHSASIRQAPNLRIEDFSCRYRVIEEAFIGLAESALVSVFSPVWNIVLDGFGNNPTGEPRSAQRQSKWDTFHPGRVRGLGQTDQGVDVLHAQIENHLRTVATVECVDERVEAIKDRIKRYGLG